MEGHVRCKNGGNRKRVNMERWRWRRKKRMSKAEEIEKEKGMKGKRMDKISLNDSKDKLRKIGRMEKEWRRKKRRSTVEEM